MNLIRRMINSACQKIGICPVREHGQFDRFDYEGENSSQKFSKHWQDRYQELTRRQQEARKRLQNARVLMVRTDVRARRPLNTEVVDDELRDSN